MSVTSSPPPFGKILYPPLIFIYYYCTWKHPVLVSYKHLHSYKDYTCNKTVMHITLSLSTHMKWILAIEIINREYVTQDEFLDQIL